MERKAVDKILAYYAEIPEMIRLLMREKKELELEYSSVRGIPIDGTQGGTGSGRPTENLAIRMMEHGPGGRLKEIEVKVQVLQGDTALIRGCLDGMIGKYKMILLLRSVYKYSWGKISVNMKVPESTARNWYRQARDKLGKELDFVPMTEELYRRASRAR